MVVPIEAIRLLNEAAYLLRLTPHDRDEWMSKAKPTCAACALRDAYDALSKYVGIVRQREGNQ